eukprot:CAMPEP_0202912488 /NCGR_PEP_ID=MMETSP1392-20130828/57892_1 /ASSEMBLY_ACC=CAM_ASM_000868 /TAXON_ID=225041 /ORGANISM="Chlamydomonas chlamydogama, Strain SAG 11-48b" /LENGTH=193 /DNA_ID=CAMNT_0049603409 /DNA_START=57 /DNA_END=636 /DNA_ORIENTATION=+
MASPNDSLTVLTLNIWGLLIVSKKRQQRVKYLGEYLKQARNTLDAVFCHWLSMKVADHEAAFWRYAAAGDPAAITCGDYYAGKGFGWSRIATPKGPVDVFNTHIHANYSHRVSRHHHSATSTSSSSSDTVFMVPQDDFAPYRMSQVLELAQAIRHISSTGSIGVVLGGDLNAKPFLLEMALLRVLLPGLRDAW